jgi:hypothetical protein
MTIKIISDRENKKERGYREVIGCGVSTPSDSMIEFRLNTGEGGYVLLWMTCQEARNFCKLLNNSLLYHEEFGEQNTYVPVDRYAPGYDPKDYMATQARMKTGKVTTTIEYS